MSLFIENTVSRVIAHVAKSDTPINLDTTLAALNLNSAKVMQVIAQLENELDFELEDHDLVMPNFLSGRHIVNLLVSRYSRIAAE